MIELSEFGTIIQNYTGKGQLIQKGHNHIDCMFEAGQMTDGAIFLIGNVDDNDIYPTEAGEISFVGKTREGENLFANGYVIRTQYNPNFQDGHSTHQFVLRSSGFFEFSVGAKDWRGQAQIHFYITNFNFVGMHGEEVGPGQRNLNHIRIKLADKEIIIRRLSDYESRLKRAKDNHGIDVTSEIILETEHEKLQETFELVLVVCDLLSIARGKRINWLYYDVFIDNQRVYREHQPRIVTPYAGFEVIDDMPPKNTVEFLQQCYPHYVRLDERFRFRNVANIYAAVRSGGFTETRCLAAFALAEYLAKKTTNPPHNRNFRKWLESIVLEYAVPITGAEIECFVKLRNKLVHELEWIPGETSEQYRLVLHFLDRLLLRILGYEGYYLPVTEFPEWSGANKHKLTPVSDYLI